jgi:hypothetical protein
VRDTDGATAKLAAVQIGGYRVSSDTRRKTTERKEVTVASRSLPI